jgi:hypothetical protein
VKHRVLTKGACDYTLQILAILSPQSPTLLAKVMATWLSLERVNCMDSFSADMALVGATIVAVVEVVLITSVIKVTLVLYILFERLFIGLLLVVLALLAIILTLRVGSG